MKTFKKSIVCFMLMFAMVFSLAACGSKTEEKSGDATPAATKGADDGKDKDKDATPEPTSDAEPTENAAPSGSGDDGTIREGLTSLEFQTLMGNGINLGNTLESTDRDYSSKTLAEMTNTYGVKGCENSWGQPTTTQEMMNTMKAGGFDSIRLPIAWTTFMDNISTGDYTINPEFLDRVQEIVDYARNADMYVIINDHWDGGWWGMFGSSDTAVQQQAHDLYVSMWTQIAERFKDYSDYVIFEGGNEELGNRFNDKIAGTAGTLSADDCYKKSLEVNQLFVDTVRATGGNNAERFLLIPGYNTDITMTCDSRFFMPDDAANKLLISVHYYTPWAYCGEKGMSNWGSATNLTEMNDLLASMKKFTDEGYGVIIGEYAVLVDNGVFKENTDLFYNNFLDNCDLYGYVPMLWDCSNLLDRRNCSWTNDEIIKIYTDRKADTRSEEEKATAAKAAIEERLNNANESVVRVTDDPDASVAWIMFNSEDYNITYSVGDVYTPENTTAGLKTTDVVVEGDGTYTVALDFTGVGGANGTAFMAVGISNGENNFPYYVIDIKEIKVNGEPIELIKTPYTTTDDNICTRVNIYNEWVKDKDIKKLDYRLANGADEDKLSAVVIDRSLLRPMDSIEITFDFYEEA